MDKIIWSDNAKAEILDIVDFWNRKNKSNSYTNKLLSHVEIALRMIVEKPMIGLKTNIPFVRMRLVLKHFYIIYEITDLQIEVLRFWDVRQNPVKINFKIS